MMTSWSTYTKNEGTLLCHLQLGFISYSNETLTKMVDEIPPNLVEPYSEIYLTENDIYGDEIEIVKKCNCELVTNEQHFGSNHEGILQFWTEGGKMSWLKVPNKKSKTLEEVHLTSSVRNVFIKLVGNPSYAKSVSKAIEELIIAGILIDWLLLNCEAKEKDFCEIRQVTLHSIDSFTGLTSAVYHNSCLPLPFIYKNQNNSHQYFYFVFNQGGNSKVFKLNKYLFSEVEFNKFNGGEIKQGGGLVVNDKFTKKTERFTFYATSGFDSFVRENEIAVKKLILSHHVIWGHLQCWVRKMVKKFKNMFSVDEIAQQLSLCCGSFQESGALKEIAIKTQMLYSIGFLRNYFLYLKFSTLSKGERSGYSITIVNHETDFVYEEPVIQYFRQYLYMHEPIRPSGFASLSDPNVVACFSTVPTNPHVALLAPVPIGGEPFGKATRALQAWNPVPPAADAFPGDRLQSLVRPVIKTRTVEEINSAKSFAVEDAAFPLQKCSAMMTFIKEGKLTTEEVRHQLLPYIRFSLDSCYATNAVEISERDETDDEKAIEDFFNAAVSSADVTGTFYLFLNQIFKFLQLHFTNRKCKQIMDFMIYEELRSKHTCVWNPLQRGEPVRRDKISGPDTKPCAVVLDRGQVEEYFKMKSRDDGSPPGGSRRRRTKKRREERRPADLIQSEVVVGSTKDSSSECVPNNARVVLTRVEDLIDFNWRGQTRVKSLGFVRGEKTKTRAASDDRRNRRRQKVKLFNSPAATRKTRIRRREILEMDAETLALLYSWKNEKRENFKNERKP